MTAADLLLENGRITTLDAAVPEARWLAMKNGRVAGSGTGEVPPEFVGPRTRRVDLGGRRAIPGLNDSHLHVIRGGLNYHLELRWDGVPSLADAMRMLRAQVARTPPGQWVRVVGGFSELQFAERRLPTLRELDEAAPDTPVFILHLYDRALLNRAALRFVGYGRDTPDPPGGVIERDGAGNPTGLLVANPNAGILYRTLALGPKLPHEQRLVSTRRFLRELNRLGVTSACDAGGGFQAYPDDYAVVRELDARGELTLRIAFNLFTQRPKAEREDFARWTAQDRLYAGGEFLRLNGAGEMLVHSASDFEDFRVARPDLPPETESELEGVVELLARARWPFRMHATYDETISRALDVFERVDRRAPLADLRWFLDHCETVSDRNLDRIAALGGGVAIQHRMAFQGEEFVARYGARAAERTPPIRRMLEAGLPVGAGTDATRVASYNPWTALAWMTTGRTVGGMKLYPDDRLLGREEALRLYTAGSAWFSREEDRKGTLATGKFADVAVLTEDYFAVPAERIRGIESALTVVDGKVVHGAGPFASLAPPPPPVLPEWSPETVYPGHWSPSSPTSETGRPGGPFAHEHDLGLGGCPCNPI